MISSKDLYLDEYDRNGAAAALAMRQEYEAWQAWQTLLAWADARIVQAEQFFLDLRQDGYAAIELPAGDERIDPEWNWFMTGDSWLAEGREIVFRPDVAGWRITA